MSEPRSGEEFPNGIKCEPEPRYKSEMRTELGSSTSLVNDELMREEVILLRHEEL
jgi:hypothetical protein